MATALSPVLGAVAVNEIARDHSFKSWAGWLIAAALLICLCWWLLAYAKKNAEVLVLHISEFERNDKEILGFLLTYFLPLLSANDMTFKGAWLTGAYILLVIFLVFAHAGAFHFNPVMGLLGYHFYSVKNAEGMSHVLISRVELRRAKIDIRTVRLAHGIHLNVSDSDA